MEDEAREMAMVRGPPKRYFFLGFAQTFDPRSWAVSPCLAACQAQSFGFRTFGISRYTAQKV